VSTCQACHEHPAVVHLTQLIDGVVTTVHLCGRCAAEQGVAQDTAPVTTPLGSFLAALGPLIPEPDLTETGLATTGCPECGATLADIRASGRLGCATCWTTFDRPLRDLVRRLHGSTRHLGEWYHDPATAADGESAHRVAHERIRLREALREAVAAEAFETAAQLRDELRALEEAP
jgi:protein arginine kinase activator